MKLEDLASQLGFKSADGLFEVVGKDEYSLRNIENLLRPPEPALSQDDLPAAQEIARNRNLAQRRGAGGGP
jgi:GTP pyrophosphokinase